MKIYFLICESCYLVPSIIQNGKGVEKCESLGLTPTEFVVGFLAGMLFVGVQLLQRYGYVGHGYYGQFNTVGFRAFWWIAILQRLPLWY